MLETITAIATPPGKGGVGIIRISGKDAKKIAETITKKILIPRYAIYSNFYTHDLITHTSKSIIDNGIVLYFPNPHSFTGEDVVELQGHGGPVILDILLEEVLKHGARLANPGEFSERAFLNDKIDLSQAEAIADLINAGSKQAAKAAINSLQGKFSEKINELKDLLIQLRMYVEAAIDFPEEEVDFLSDQHISLSIVEIKNQFKEIIAAAMQGQLLQEGINIVIIGKPNAGKSSLLNQLAGQDRAIVTEIAGTTRDVLKEYIQIDGLPLHIIDTAGLRETTDLVEKIGIERAYQEIEKAEYVLFIIDAIEFNKINFENLIVKWKINSKKIIFIKNKIDLVNEKPAINTTEFAEITKKTSYITISISAKTGEGIDLLKNHLKTVVGYQQQEGVFLARRRHLEALNRALALVEVGEIQLEQAKAGELLAEDLRLAQLALAEITGEFTADDLLGEIFSNFCIGK